MWRPTKGAQSLGVAAPSSFLQAMSRAFGGPPFKLAEEHLSILDAMAGVYSHPDNPYSKVAEIIRQHGEIEIWAEY